MNSIIKLKYTLLLYVIAGVWTDTMGTELTGPSNVCSKGYPTSFYYEARSCFPGGYGEYTWYCSNCEIQDSRTSQWSSIVQGGSYMAVRFLNSTGSSASITVSASGIECVVCVCSWDKTVYFDPPSTQGTIYGDNELMNCGSYSNIYALNGLTNGWQLSHWTTSSGLTIVGSTSNLVTIKPSNGGVTGSKTIYAKIKWRDESGQLCPISQISKNVTVVYPNLNVTGPTQICPGGLYQYYATFDGATEPVPSASYSWTYPSGYYSLNGNSNYSLNLQAPQYNPQGGAVHISVTLPCGSYNNGLTIYPYCYGGYSYSVNPNPSTTELIIEIIYPDDQGNLFQSSEGNTVELLLMKEDGLIVIRKKLKKNKEIVDIRRLKPDNYYLKILVNNYELDKTKRIVKK